MHMEYHETEHNGESEDKVIICDRLADGPQKLSVMINPAKPDNQNGALTRKLSFWLTQQYSQGDIGDMYKYEVLRSNAGATETEEAPEQLGAFEFLGLFTMYL